MYKTCHLFFTYFFHNGTDSVCSRNFDFYATSSSLNKFSSEPNSRVFLLLRQLWIVNYYFKSLSNNLSNENIKTGVSREIIFKK